MDQTRKTAKWHKRKIRADYAQSGSCLRVGLLASFLMVVSVYLPSLDNDFIYDDTQVILEQKAPRSIADVARIFTERHFPNLPYYRPITRMTLLVQKSLHGDNPVPFHFMNILLMGMAMLLAYALLRLPAFGIHHRPALIASALFALHPIASSCVYPISSGRETLLPSVWTLAALYAYLHKGRGWRILAFWAFIGGLLSKEQAVVVPFLFVLADALRLSAHPPGRDARRWLQRYWPFVTVFFIYAMIRHQLFGTTEYVLNSLVLGPFLSVAYALQTIFFPFAELVYEPTILIWLSLSRLLLAATVLSVLAIFIFRRWSHMKVATEFWTGWFLITLLPTANLLRQEASFDERYVFLASFALFGLVAALVSTASDNPQVRRWTTAAGTVLVLAWSLISFHRSTYFKDDVTFSQQWLRTNPGIADPHYNLGSSLKKYTKFEQAILRSCKQWFLRDTASVNAHYNLGFALAKQGKFEAAIIHYSEALRLQPDLAYAHNNLGNALCAVGRYDEATTHFYRALQIKPDYVDAHYNLGVLLARSGKLDEAIAHFSLTLQFKPNSSDTRNSLDYAAAHNNLGNALAQKGRFGEAIHQYSEALRIRPEYADAHNNMANALVTQKRFQEAVAHYSTALNIKPDYADAQHNLEMVLNQFPELRKQR